jgi:hypothetical protein
MRLKKIIIKICISNAAASDIFTTVIGQISGYILMQKMMQYVVLANREHQS